MLVPIIPPEQAPAESANLLEWIHSLVVGCRRCRLSQSRRNTVPGEGNPNASLMLVGEAPGAAEDAQGRPFVGAAGQLLTALLAEIGISRAEVFITNVVKCRPPGNRDPQEDEIAACNDYLLGQIASIRPRVIATLGRHAMHTLISADLSISRAHGKHYFQQGILFIPIFHPAYALHEESRRGQLREDMQALKRLLEESGAAGQCSQAEKE
jgi:DNA polymerase